MFLDFNVASDQRQADAQARSRSGLSAAFVGLIDMVLKPSSTHF
jgi:hypothetical protein